MVEALAKEFNILFENVALPEGFGVFRAGSFPLPTPQRATQRCAFSASRIAHWFGAVVRLLSKHALGLSFRCWFFGRHDWHRLQGEHQHSTLDWPQPAKLRKESKNT